MKASDIYKVLSTEAWWASQRKAVRWIAARLYAGVDSIEDVERLTKPIHVNGDSTIAPVLTKKEFDEIIRSW